MPPVRLLGIGALFTGTALVTHIVSGVSLRLVSARRNVTSSSVIFRVALIFLTVGVLIVLGSLLVFPPWSPR